MNVQAIARLIYDYTSGYPFLISRICKLVDEEISLGREFEGKTAAWTKDGVLLAVRMLIAERNSLFESLTEKLDNYPELERILHTLLFVGKEVPYNADSEVISLASMFGFVKIEMEMSQFPTVYSKHVFTIDSFQWKICRKMIFIKRLSGTGINLLSAGI